MKKTWFLGVFMAVGLTLAAGALIPAPAQAEKGFPDKLLSLLPILHKDNQESCKICHTQTKNPETGKKDPKWNVFGEAMKKAKADQKAKPEAKDPTFVDMFNAVRNLDSDGDGVSNIVELVAGSKPGDKESKPSEEATKEAQAKIAEYDKKMAAEQGGEEKKDATTPAPAPAP